MSGLFEGGLRKVVELGYYHHRPDQVRNAYIGGGIATMVFLLVGLGFLGERFEAFYFPLGAGVPAAVLTAIPIIGFGMVMPARTIEGARQLAHVLGLQ